MPKKPSPLDVRTIPIRAASDSELLSTSRRGLLSLSLEEMRVIQSHCRDLRRDPTDVELETIAQTWSEHCKHKTFRGVIEYEEEGGGDVRVYDDLLKSTIMKATQELRKPWCWSVFKDNAGVIAFDETDGLAFKVETHNHPSALEPCGGAGTGVGGVIRDILGCGRGAKPLLNTDVFAFAPEDLPPSRVPKGSLSPRRIIQGVVAGVRDYGNRMGIPTANGAVFFDERYVSNPLVYCGTVGLIPKEKVEKSVRSGDLVVVIGGRTGRDGIHGATFSSAALEAGIASSVVQIGHAIMEKRMMDVLLQARDQNLFRSVTDCGAGGFSSAVGELASPAGACVDLTKVPLKYPGLAPWEIWLSESQERMVLAVPPERWPVLEALARSEGVEATVIGEFASSGNLEIDYDGERVGELDMRFLHDGMPRMHRKAKWSPQPPHPSPVHLLRGLPMITRSCSWAGPLPQGERGSLLEFPRPLGERIKVRGGFATVLKKLLIHPNIASKKWIIQQYDHEVQGGSVIKPLLGFEQKGLSDATVFRPKLDSWRGAVVSNGFNPWYSLLDPYWMAALAIDEALRNLIAVGGNLEHAALLDNFCWGDPGDPQQLAGLVRAAQACADMSKAYSVPFISGKDSLNNTWRDRKGKFRSIPGSLLISALGVMEDVRRCVTMDLKNPGDLIYLVGETRNEFGGSHFNAVTGQPLTAGHVPHVYPKKARPLMRKLHRAIQKGFIRACHDLSEGGLAVAAAEMCTASGLGMDLDVSAIGDPVMVLFSESSSRFLIEVPAKARSEAETIWGKDIALLGKVAGRSLKVRCGKKVLLR